jgi:hypothetical protein
VDPGVFVLGYKHGHRVPDATDAPDGEADMKTDDDDAALA